MFGDHGVVAVLAEAISEQKRKNGKSNLLSEEPSVMLHWAADLYMVRHAVTHGTNGDCISAWTLDEHKYYGTAAACLMTP